MHEKLASRAVLAAFALTAIFFSGQFPPFANPNELSRLEAVYAAGELGTLSIDGAIPVLGDHEDKSVSNGRFYSNKAPGLALAALPVYKVLRVVFPKPRASSDAVFVWLRLLTVSLASVLALARFLRRLASSASGPLVGFAVAFGTPFLFYARSFFAHAWVAALLFLSWDLMAAARVREGSRRVGALYAAAGLLAGWAAISEYTAAPLLIVLAFATRSGRRLLPFAAGAAMPLAVLLFYDAVCFGSPFVLSSAREAYGQYSALSGKGFFGFGAPSPTVAAEYLFQPARGLLLFSPFWIWLVPGFARWRRLGADRRAVLVCLVAVAGFFVILCGYPNWHGGWAIGNRYLLPVLFFAGLALPHALTTPLSRGVFAIAAIFAVTAHVLMTSSWPHFPVDLPWPPATGSLWFLSRDWFAPNVLSGVGALSLLLPAAAAAAAGGLCLRAAAPLAPPSAAGFAAALLLFAVPLAARPTVPYGARLWRAAIFGAYSGVDPRREELQRVVREAATPSDMRRAAGAWRLYGPPRASAQGP
ncbi:MAG TPA: hypothetical protein VMQ61_05570 [Thermoanaerobaculia bacterium]|nr:hypothetical protein [Thermoanaerobaculia bacterium]